MSSAFGKNVSLPKVIIDKITITNRAYPLRTDPHTGISEPQSVPDGASDVEPDGLLSKKNLETVFLEVKVLLKEEKGKSGKYKIFDNETILKNLKIKVLHIKNKNIHNKIIQSNSPLTYDKITEQAGMSEGSVQGQVVNVFSDLDDRKLKQKYIGKKGNSNKEFYIPYTFTFTIQNVKNGYNPDFLSYFAYCTLDSESMEESLGIDKGTLGDPLRGSLSAEIVYDEGKLRATAYAYYRQDNGELYSLQNSKIFQAGGPGGPWVGQPDGSSEGVYLNAVEVINTKIHNYRKTSLLKNIDLEGDFDLDVIREKIINKKYQQAAANKHDKSSAGDNFSNLYLAEDSHGGVKMLFSFNWKSILLSKTLFPRIFENTANYVLAEIINKSKIVSFRAIRKKIPLSAASSLKLVNNQSAAPLGSDNKTNVHTQDHDLYENEDVFVHIQGTINPGSSITYKRLYPESSEVNGTFTELNYSTPGTGDAERGIRTFSLTDHNVKRYTEGKYQYGIEMEFIDGSIDWLRDKKNNLLNPLKALRKYYLSSTLSKFYMEEAGKFTEYFINLSESQGAAETVLNCIQAYCEVLEALFNKTVDEEIVNVLYSIAAPASGTPEGILTFLNLVESIYSKLDEVLDRISAKPPIPGETDSAVEGSSKTTFGSVGNKQKIVHYFSNLYEKERYFGGYNFIFPNHNSGINAKGNEAFSKGLSELPFSTYRKRVTQEMQKYYTVDVSSNETLNWSSFNLGFVGDSSENSNIDFSNRKYSYLTPTTVNLVGEETNCLHLSKKVKGVTELSAGEKSAFAKIISDIMKFNLQKTTSLSHTSNLGTFHNHLQDTEKEALELRQELRNILDSMSIVVANSKDNFSLLNSEDNEKEEQLKNIETDEESELLDDSLNQQLADIPEGLNFLDYG